MTLRFARHRALSGLLTATALLALAGCESRTHLTLTPLGAEAAGVPAIARALEGGAQAIVIPDPAGLPAALREARDLKVSIQGRLLNVTRQPTGAYEFQLPTGLRPTLAKDGTLTVLFVLDETQSRLVRLETGSPVAFAADPVGVAPAGRLSVGRAVTLTAATEADEAAYEFAWSVAAAPEGPWRALSLVGKRITWTPDAPGSYFVRVEAIDRARRVTHAAQTSARALHVIEPDALFTVSGGGAVPRGTAVELGFALPDGAERDRPLAWYAGPSATGPWTPLSGTGVTNRWLPTLPGSYHLRVDLAGQAGTDVYVSTRPLVRVLEGAPLIRASRAATSRGDRVDLTLAVPDAAVGPISWYAAQPGQAWAPVPGNGASVKFLPDQPGAYNFRVDLSQPDGTVKTLTTSEPILNVAETPGFLTTNPFPGLARAGESVTITMKAQALDGAGYHFVWYVSANPQLFGWTPIPFDQARDARKTSVTWDVPATQALGNYFVRVDAIEDATGHVYPFLSSAPLVLLTLSD